MDFKFVCYFPSAPPLISIFANIFWKKFQEILSNPDFIKKHAEKWLKNQNTRFKLSSTQIEEYKNKIDKLKKEETRYARMYGEGIIDSEQFEDLINGTKAKRSRYNTEIENLRKKASSKFVAKIELEDLCEEAQVVIKSLADTDKKQIIRDLVDRVIIKKGGNEVESWIHIPIQAHYMGYGAKRRNSWSS